MTLGQLARFSGSSALVLKEAQINESGALRIHLKGRPRGFKAWLLTLIGLDDTTTLDVYENKIVYSSSSLSGKFSETTPLSSISNVGAGFLKPFLYLIFAVICLFIAIVGGFSISNSGGMIFFLFFLLTAGGFVFSYWTQKSLLLYVIPNSGAITAFAVKRSLIENISISQETAERIISIIEKLIEVNTSKA